MSEVYYYNTKFEWLILNKREEMEFDTDKEYVQQVVRDKGKGKYMEENRSNTFGERQNLWKRQASKRKRDI